uniref:Uncharacterized protein n=1 Tax=Anguilla anguilla TaxID=7936 RepID=A0A0E9QUC1_ANGAN
MALRGPLLHLFRRQLNIARPNQIRAHSVAILGAPFSKGQVKHTKILPTGIQYCRVYLYLKMSKI